MNFGPVFLTNFFNGRLYGMRPEPEGLVYQGFLRRLSFTYVSFPIGGSRRTRTFQVGRNGSRLFYPTEGVRFVTVHTQLVSFTRSRSRRP